MENSTLPSPLQWTDAYKIGVDKVDTQHRFLFETINYLGGVLRAPEPDPDVVMKQIDFLVTWYKAHFIYEESCFGRACASDGDCATRGRNRNAHDEMLARVKTIVDQAHFPMRRIAAARDLYTASCEWLVDHVANVDNAFSTCQSSPGAHGADTIRDTESETFRGDSPRPSVTPAPASR